MDNLKVEKIGVKKTIHILEDVSNTAVVHVKDFDSVILVDDEGNHVNLGKQLNIQHLANKIIINEGNNNA